MEELWLLNTEYLDRYSTYNRVSAAMCFSLPRVYAEDLKNEGHSRLWEPYQDWLDKVWKMPITLIKKQKEHSEELREFKEEMSRAIKEAETVLINKEKDKEKQKKQRAGSRVEREIANSIEEIERLMTEKGLQAQDLGEHSFSQVEFLWGPPSGARAGVILVARFKRCSCFYLPVSAFPAPSVSLDRGSMTMNAPVIRFFA